MASKRERLLTRRCFFSRHAAAMAVTAFQAFTRALRFYKISTPRHNVSAETMRKAFKNWWRALPCAFDWSYMHFYAMARASPREIAFSLALGSLFKVFFRFTRRNGRLAPPCNVDVAFQKEHKTFKTGHVSRVPSSMFSMHSLVAVLLVNAWAAGKMHF